MRNDKNMLLALLLSMLLMGLGLFLRHASAIFLVIAMILWVYTLYETYMEVKIVNGEPNPNLIKDIQTGNFENIAPLVAIVLLLIVYYFVVRTMFY